MKLPFDFGVKLIFRLVLPGFLLSLGFLPLLRLVLQLQGWWDKWEYAFVVMIVLLGWAVIIADMPIYILMEGRRFWPGFITRFTEGRLSNRLKSLKAKTEDIEQLSHLKAKTDSEPVNDPNAKTKESDAEAWFKLRGNFQMNGDGDYEVVLPSRLGNVIYAFEGYSERTYGLDAIFYWPRIWLKLDKDTREEIDNNQALVDSAVYAAFAFYTSALLWVLYAIVKLLIVFAQGWFTLTPRIQYDLTLIDQRLPRKGLALLVAAIFLVFGYLIYRMSLYLYAQFGEFFKSIFDTHISEINVSPIMEEISRLTAKSSHPVDPEKLTKRDQFTIAWRYLQYYRYRCPSCNAFLKPNKIEGHVCGEKKPTTEDSLEQRRATKALPAPDGNTAQREEKPAKVEAVPKSGEVQAESQPSSPPAATKDS